MTNNESIRINKYLAMQGISTRKGADKLILAGKITINGRKAVLGDKVKEGDKVEITKKLKNNFVYYAYNKPRGVITHSPQNGEKDIISSINLKGIFPIGRLDKDSEGLILLTNDGRITDRLLNPEYDHDKEYVVTTRIPIKDYQLKAMEKGMDIEGITTAPCKTKYVDQNIFSITLSEGQKHQIRRMCDALTLPINNLKRIRIMNIKLGNLKSNMYRKIEEEELKTFLQLLGLN
ncbi:MAG: pseudouridine synthase [bacterium]